MSRSQQNQQLQTGNTMTATENANAGQALNTLMPSYTQQLQNPGYNPAEKSAITNATTQGIGAAYGSAAEGATNAAARTNNQAGLTSNMDALARQRMITSGNLAANNQVTFANEAEKQKAAAQQGIGNIYGTNVNAANTTMGVNARNAATPSFWEQFGTDVSKGFGTAVGNWLSPPKPASGSSGSGGGGSYG